MQEIRKKLSETNHEKMYYQYGSNPCLLHLSLQINFGDERGNDSHHLFFQTGHKTGPLAVTVCADGTKLPPMLIFKGKQKSRLLQMTMYPTGCEYFCQENAWMDKGAMIWAEKISN